MVLTASAVLNHCTSLIGLNTQPPDLIHFLQGFGGSPKFISIDYSDAVRKGVLRGLGETTAPLEIKPGIESKLDLTVNDRQAEAQAVYNKQFGTDDLSDHKTLLYFKIDEDLPFK